MQHFVTNAQVALLEDGLIRLRGLERLQLLVPLAWHLRQRDCERSLDLAGQAQALAADTTLGEKARQAILARIVLTRAEIKLVFAQLDEAWELAQSAREQFGALTDTIGLGDSLWTLASIRAERGTGEDTDDYLKQAIDAYRTGGDSARERSCIARRMMYASFRDPVGTGLLLAVHFSGEEQLPPAVDYWVSAVKANVAALTNDPGTAIKDDLAAYHTALECGQIRQALVCVNNAVEGFTTLGDLDAALDWSEPALALARKTGWPASVGVCLMQTGDVLRLLGRHSEARDQLQEALDLMSAFTGSRNYEQVMGNLGQLALDMGDYPKGLEWFVKFEEQVTARREADLLIKALRGQASALLHLGRLSEAQAKASAALALAQEKGNADGQIQILLVLAQVHLQHDTASVQTAQGPTEALHLLQQAMEIATDIKGYGAAPELLHQLAFAHAACGDYKSAYEKGLLAHEARASHRGEEAQRRMLATHIRQEVERARAETDLHREKAATLQETAATLETLGIIGREITASLNTQAVFDALYRHVNDLLDATSFVIYLIDEEHKLLTAAFAVELGLPINAPVIPVTSPNSNFAKCARTRKEILVDMEPNSKKSNRIPGSIATLSLLYAPLVAGDRLLGVMSIQSQRRNVYKEREQSIFRAICAYGAIALDNASAYAKAELAQRTADQAVTELRHTQARLVEQNQRLERLAVTDQLTGLFNRLRLDRTLEEEHSRNMRYGTQFCVLLLDVDEFKSVNDNFGHQTGDEVLLGIARILQNGVREVDVVGRWGGEEFLIICRETTIDGALVLAEKLRAAVHAHVFDRVGSRSASFGAAMFRTGELLTETIARADAALYRAKQSGRNKVVDGEAEFAAS